VIAVLRLMSECFTEVESMLTRRRAARFELLPSCPGTWRIAHDVRVLSVEETVVQVLCRAPGVKGERGLLELVHRGQCLSVPVRVEKSTPVVSDGQVCYELRLAVVAPATPDNASPTAAEEYE